MEWLLIVVVIGKRLEQQNTVKALNGDRNALKKEGRFFVLSWDRRNASSKGVDKVNIIIIIKPPLATARAASSNGRVHLFVCLFVCLSVAKLQKRDFLKNEAI